MLNYGTQMASEKITFWVYLKTKVSQLATAQEALILSDCGVVEMRVGSESMVESSKHKLDQTIYLKCHNPASRTPSRPPNRLPHPRLQLPRALHVPISLGCVHEKLIRVYITALHLTMCDGYGARHHTCTRA